MNSYEIQIGKEYKVTYSDKNQPICKVIFKYDDGDCDVVYKNGKKATWHAEYLEEITE